VPSPKPTPLPAPSPTPPPANAWAKGYTYYSLDTSWLGVANSLIDRQNSLLKCGTSINGAPAVPCVPHAVWNSCIANALIPQAEASANAKASRLSASAATGCGFDSYAGEGFGYGDGISDTAAAKAVAPGCASSNGSAPQFAAVWGVSPSGYGYLLMVCAA
jgi:hypothetical protein